MRIPVAERREALAEAALRVLRRDGIEGVTSRAVVAEAQMSLASLHYAFNSISELLRAVVEYSVQQEQREREEVVRLARRGDKGRDAIAHGLRVGVAMYLERVEATPEHFQGMFELSLKSFRSRDLAPIARWQYEQYRRLAQEALDSSAAAADMRWRNGAADVAALLVALCNGIALSHLAGQPVSWTMIEHAIDGIVGCAEDDA